MSSERHTVSLRLDENDHDDLMEICRNEGISKSDLIREAIRDKMSMLKPEGNSVVIRMEIPIYHWNVINSLVLRGYVQGVEEYIRLLIHNNAELKLQTISVQNVSAGDARGER